MIDVEGKQCSDFLAFHRQRLEDGVERGLDATVTRSLTGNAYPTPGLFGKFYDADMNPLVEVVRDTVGRHDTFQLACYAKYYEDMGYPGHINCTDNFNGALDPFGVAKREGWPALNFFYNTSYADRLSGHGRAVVAAGRLRAPAGDDRPRLRVVGVPRRHRPGERLADHRRPRPRVPAPSTRSRRRSRTA